MASLGLFFGLGEEKHRALADSEMTLDVLKNIALTFLLEHYAPNLFFQQVQQGFSHANTSLPQPAAGEKTYNVYAKYNAGNQPAVVVEQDRKDTLPKSNGNEQFSTPSISKHAPASTHSYIAEEQSPQSVAQQLSPATVHSPNISTVSFTPSSTEKKSDEEKQVTAAQVTSVCQDAELLELQHEVWSLSASSSTTTTQSTTLTTEQHVTTIQATQKHHVEQKEEKGGVYSIVTDSASTTIVVETVKLPTAPGGPSSTSSSSSSSSFSSGPPSLKDALDALTDELDACLALNKHGINPPLPKATTYISNLSPEYESLSNADETSTALAGLVELLEYCMSSGATASLYYAGRTPSLRREVLIKQWVNGQNLFRAIIFEASETEDLLDKNLSDSAKKNSFLHFTTSKVIKFSLSP